MRVNDAELTGRIQWANKRLSRANELAVALDLLDARATLAQRDERIKELEERLKTWEWAALSKDRQLLEFSERINELEQTLASSQTASDEYYAKLTANKEAAEQRIAELEGQLGVVEARNTRMLMWMKHLTAVAQGKEDGTDTLMLLADEIKTDFDDQENMWQAAIENAKKVGAAEELERMAGKVGHQFTGIMRFNSLELFARAVALRKEAVALRGEATHA